MPTTDTSIDQILYDAIGLVRRPSAYSGRNMYGKYCLAFATKHIAGDVAEIVAGVEDIVARDAVARAFSWALTDSMGLGSVVYFPGVPWQAGWADDAEDGE